MYASSFNEIGMLGDLLDNRYRIIRTLSKGGFGQTYIAEDTRRPGCPRCVMKHLKPIILEPDHLNNARRLFHTEAIALEKLGHHPQIPRLLAYFEENNDFYLVQDLIRGYPLTKELKTGFKWLEADIYQLLYDALSILIYVHDRGVIHRDIKPDNIIRRQMDRALVLVDFGSVKQIRTHLHPNHETGQTISIGTIGYMSTEQAHGRPRPNSDLYSLGIIGIQAATGIKPKNFQEDKNTGELIWRDQADISDGLADFLETMVAYHFKDRYLDARAALRALKLIKPESSPRYALGANDLLLAKPSYWSVTASRLTSALTSLRPALPNTPVSQPTFIELPEPTEVSAAVTEKRSDPLRDEGLDNHSSTPKAYVSPLVQPDADATTEVIENGAASRESKSIPLPTDHSANEAPVRQERNDAVPLPLEPDEMEHPLEADFALEPSRNLPTALVSFDEMLSPLAALRVRIRTLLTTSSNFGVQAITDAVQPFTQGWPSQIRTVFWVCGGLGAIALSLWGVQFGYTRQTAFKEKEALSTMQSHQQEGRYLECLQTIQEFDSPSEALNKLGYQCAFQGVQTLVEAEEWTKAIAIANAIPADATRRHEAQVFIRGQHMLAFSDAQQAGDLKRAMVIADEIDPNHPLQAEIQLARLKWQAEEQLWVQGLDLLDQGKWQEASDRVRPLEASPYFQERAKALLKEADLKQKQTTADDSTIEEFVTGESTPGTPSAPEPSTSSNPPLTGPSATPSRQTIPKPKPKS